MAEALKLKNEALKFSFEIKAVAEALKLKNEALKLKNEAFLQDFLQN